MGPSVRQCDSKLLRRLLDGCLSGPDERAVIEHLDTCASCQRELEVAAGDATSWRDLQDCLAEGLPSQTSSGDLTVDANVGLSHPLEVATHSFLAPSDDPRMLGRIGLYEIAGLIGRGSTGIVFKAFEPSLHRYVAIKVLAPELAHSSAGRKRFAREACAAAAVTHEHIVPIYAVSEFQGLPYIVMQYVAGHSLQERIDRHGPLGVVEAVRIALQTARALAAAHQQGLVHRDIKPGNILLASGIENALVTDFGLARVADDASMTHSGLISGTPQYMSPEQARGETAGPQSDLFSLGSVIYAMCTGHSPFRAETMFGVIRRVCEAMQRPMREVIPDVPGWLDRFTERLLSKAPEKRFRDAVEVVALLEAELAHLQNPTVIPVPKRGWMMEECRWPRWRRKLVVAWAGMTLLAALGSIWITSALMPEAANQARNAADDAETFEKTRQWNGATIHYRTGDNVIVETAQDAEQFLMTANAPNGQHELIVQKADAGKCSLKIVVSMSRDADFTRKEFMDELYLNEVFVHATRETFSVNAKGRKPRASGSHSSSSSQSTTSDSDGQYSRSSFDEKVQAPSTTEFTVSYATMPSTTDRGEHLTMLCRAYGEQHALLECDEKLGQSTLTIVDSDGRSKHTIVLKANGVLDANGDEYPINGEDVSVTARHGSLKIAVGNKELVSIRG